MANEVTLLLNEIGDASGDTNSDVLDKLLPIVYNELRRLAASFLNRDTPYHYKQPSLFMKPISKRRSKNLSIGKTAVSFLRSPHRR